SLQAPLVAGGKVTLSGSAPDGAVTLEAGQGATWHTVASGQASAGIVSFQRPLGESARYRLVVAGQPSNVVTVSVATGLALRAPRGSTFRGRLYPGIANRVVLLQRLRNRTVWRTVERTRTQAGGAFRFRTHVAAGYWRARFTGDPVMR